MTIKELNSLRTDIQLGDRDLVIVGGGIVGATLAAALKNSGLKITIIEAKPLAVAAAKTQAYWGLGSNSPPRG